MRNLTLCLKWERTTPVACHDIAVQRNPGVHIEYIPHQSFMHDQIIASHACFVDAWTLSVTPIYKL